MAEGDILFFNSFKTDLVNNNVDWTVDTIKLMLVNSYSPNYDTEEFKSAVDGASTEISGSGYTVGGETLGGKSVTKDNTNDQADVAANDVTWTSLASNTITYGVLYKDTGNAATSNLIATVEIATNSNGANYTVGWNSGVVFTLT